MKLFQVDAFTNVPFSGNPAAVCILEQKVEENWMQNLASEMNLSETAFVRMEPGRVNLRWFTPQLEVNLCGHATLATAHILWEQGFFRGDEPIDFRTKSGVLSTTKEEDSIVMNFPLAPTTPIPVDPVYNQMFRTQVLAAAKVPGNVVLEIPTAEHLKRVDPEISTIRKYSDQGIIITARGDQTYDFYTRYFAPNIGIDEDPATGFAHCVLGDYWSKKLGRNTMVAWQASRRGGKIHLEVVGDRIMLGGQAITVFQTEINP